MRSPHGDLPVVLVIAGHDPSGGAGIQADIEAVRSQGCHPVTVLTTLTIQNSCSFDRQYPVPQKTLREQIGIVLRDTEVAACKIGLIPNRATARSIAQVLSEIRSIPVVTDPVLASGSGADLATGDVITGLLESLSPLTTVLTPNIPEATRLANSGEDRRKIAQTLAGAGSEYVLITGTHAPTEHVINDLFRGPELIDRQSWERLSGVYHGSGCTLSSSIAALLARGCDPLTAVREAQAYTWHALKAGYRAGQGQLLPNRLYWAPERQPL
jgi:hydroxymethylpyrimidine/phosphomethylpyrimidine kinase